eukprot:EG_transcript_49612
MVSFLVCAASDQPQLNVYGTALQSCEGPSGHSAGSADTGRCTFRHSDRGAHQVCVKALPGGFSTKTGQGSWSDEFKERLWCICIWAFASWATTQATPLPLKCDAISSAVLDSN